MIMSKYCKFGDIKNEMSKNSNFIHNEDKMNKKIGFNMTDCKFRKGKAFIEFKGVNTVMYLKFNFSELVELVYNNGVPIFVFPNLEESIKNFFKERYNNIKDKLFDSPMKVLANEFNGEVENDVLIIPFDCGKLYIPEISYYGDEDYGYYSIDESKIYIIFNSEEVSFMDISKSKDFIGDVKFFTHKICEV